MKKNFLILKTLCLVVALVFSSNVIADTTNTNSDNSSYNKYSGMKKKLQEARNPSVDNSANSGVAKDSGSISGSSSSSTTTVNNSNPSTSSSSFPVNSYKGSDSKPANSDNSSYNKYYEMKKKLQEARDPSVAKNTDSTTNTNNPNLPATPPSNKSYFGIISPERVSNIPKNLIKGSKDFGVSNTAIRVANEALANNDKPNPLPDIHNEGILPGQGNYDQVVKAVKDFSKIENFALAYALKGDKKYLQALETFLTAWLTTYKNNFNPIDETNFDKLIIAYDLSKKDLSDSTKTLMDNFLRKMATGYLESISNQKTFDIGNFQSHRIKLTTLASFAIGDDSLVKRVHNVFTTFISKNIFADSSVHDFHARNALHYVNYDLEPLVVASIAAKEHGQDWFNQKNPAGSSVASAVRWSIPYANGTITHEEFAGSKVGFDIARANKGLAGYSGTYVTSNSIPLFGLASILDDSKEQDLVNMRDSLLKQYKRPIYGWVSIAF